MAARATFTIWIERELMSSLPLTPFIALQAYSQVLRGNISLVWEPSFVQKAVKCWYVRSPSTVVNVYAALLCIQTEQSASSSRSVVAHKFSQHNLLLDFVHARHFLLNIRINKSLNLVTICYFVNNGIIGIELEHNPCDNVSI